MAEHYQNNIQYRVEVIMNDNLFFFEIKKTLYIILIPSCGEPMFEYK